MIPRGQHRQNHIADSPEDEDPGRVTAVLQAVVAAAVTTSTTMKMSGQDGTKMQAAAGSQTAVAQVDHLYRHQARVQAEEVEDQADHRHQADHHHQARRQADTPGYRVMTGQRKAKYTLGTRTRSHG